MIIAPTAAVFIALLLFSMAPLRADDTDDWKDGTLGHLAKYIGTDKHEEVIADPYVAATLARLLGAELDHLKRNIQNHGPIEYVESYLVLTSSRTPEGNRERAIILVDTFGGEIVAGIFSGGKHTVYSDQARPRYIPAPLMKWLYEDAIEEMTKHNPRENFKWIKR